MSRFVMTTRHSSLALPRYSRGVRRAASAPAGIVTRAEPVDGGYRLNGAKIWCTGAPVADIILVAAKLAGADGRGSINLFIIERGTPGFVATDIHGKLSMRASVTSDRPFHCASEPGNWKGRPVSLQIEAYTARVVPMFMALPTAMPMTVCGRWTVQV